MTIFKNRNLLALFVASLLFFASFTGFFPVLPIQVQALGANNFWVGAVMSAFPVGILLFRPAVAGLITRWGRRGTMIAGTIGLTLASGLYLFIHSIYPLIFLRAVHGLGVAAFTTASMVYISDFSNPENRTEIIGGIAIASYVGTGLGPYLASIIQQKFGPSAVFVTATMMAALALLGLMMIQESPHQPETGSRPRLQETILQRWVLVPCGFLFVTALLQGAIIIFLPLFLLEHGDINPGLFFLFFSLSVVVIRLLAGRFTDRQGRGLVIVTASGLVLISVFVLWHLHSISGLVLAAFLYGSGFGLQQPTMSAMVADNTTFVTRSRIFSFYFATFDFGILLAGYAFGIIADLLSLNWIFPIAAGLYSLGLLFFISQIQATTKISLQWIFSRRSAGSICRICYNQMGVDPCHICGDRGGFSRLNSSPK